ncbi:MAG TPA: carboxypeptidase-like regulatory domain-containing protein [Terracidiphilus sp.]|nr:carboxypeptidase-like regulatory domain-containing protein [Terracidiphilus sp.]
MRLHARWTAGVAVAALALGLGPMASVGCPAAQAQNLGQRAVNGVVTDANSAEVAGATVFLRSAKTKAIRSYTTEKSGRFRFVQVSMSDDFDLWAEKDGQKSATKTISSWDSRKEVEVVLKLK